MRVSFMSAVSFSNIYGSPQDDQSEANCPRIHRLFELKFIWCGTSRRTFPVSFQSPCRSIVFHPIPATMKIASLHITVTVNDCVKDTEPKNQQTKSRNPAANHGDGFIHAPLTMRLPPHLFPPKYLFYRLQIFHAIHPVRFEITALGPFIPAIDIQNARAVGLG